MIELLILLAVIVLGTFYSQHKQHQLWLMERTWLREDREARLKQDHLEMEKALQLLKDSG